MAAAAIVDEHRLQSPVFWSIFGKAGGPLGAGKLFVKVGQIRESQVHLFLGPGG